MIREKRWPRFSPLSGSPLDIQHSLNLSYLICQPVQLLLAVNVKGHENSCLPLLAGTHINRSNINLPLRKHLGNIHKNPDPIVGIDLDLRGIPLLAIVPVPLLPLCINQPDPLLLRQVDHIDAVRAMNGNASSSGDESHNLISRNRAAASGKPHRHIVNTLDHNPAFGPFGNRDPAADII